MKEVFLLTPTDFRTIFNGERIVQHPDGDWMLEEIPVMVSPDVPAGLIRVVERSLCLDVPDGNEYWAILGRTIQFRDEASIQEMAESLETGSSGRDFRVLTRFKADKAKFDQAVSSGSVKDLSPMLRLADILREAGISPA